MEGNKFQMFGSNTAASPDDSGEEPATSLLAEERSSENGENISSGGCVTTLLPPNHEEILAPFVGARRQQETPEDETTFLFLHDCYSETTTLNNDEDRRARAPKEQQIAPDNNDMKKVLKDGKISPGQNTTRKALQEPRQPITIVDAAMRCTDGIFQSAVAKNGDVNNDSGKDEDCPGDDKGQTFDDQQVTRSEEQQSETIPWKNNEEQQNQQEQDIDTETDIGQDNSMMETDTTDTIAIRTCVEESAIDPIKQRRKSDISHADVEYKKKLKSVPTEHGSLMLAIYNAENNAFTGEVPADLGTNLATICKTM